MSQIDLYLDLDGVILRRSGRIEFGGKTGFDVAPGAMEFLAWAIDHFNCFWLTSRSHDGGYSEIERAFRFAIPTNTIPGDIKDVIRAIRPAPWGKTKVEGIDLSRPFFWLDDNPDQTSVDALAEAGLASRLVIVSVDQRPDALARVRLLLEGIKKGVSARQAAAFLLMEMWSDEASPNDGTPVECFRIGAETAAITHGHPTGFLSSGAMALIIRDILDGASIHEAVKDALVELLNWTDHEETTNAIQQARNLAENGATPEPEMIALMGEGWIGEEALAIGLFSALVANSIAEAVKPKK